MPNATKKVKKLTTIHPTATTAGPPVVRPYCTTPMSIAEAGSGKVQRTKGGGSGNDALGCPSSVDCRTIREVTDDDGEGHAEIVEKLQSRSETVSDQARGSQGSASSHAPAAVKLLLVSLLGQDTLVAAADGRRCQELRELHGPGFDPTLARGLGSSLAEFEERSSSRWPRLRDEAVHVARDAGKRGEDGHDGTIKPPEEVDEDSAIEISCVMAKSPAWTVLAPRPNRAHGTFIASEAKS